MQVTSCPSHLTLQDIEYMSLGDVNELRSNVNLDKVEFWVFVTLISPWIHKIYLKKKANAIHVRICYVSILYVSLC